MNGGRSFAEKRGMDSERGVDSPGEIPPACGGLPGNCRAIPLVRPIGVNEPEGWSGGHE